MGPVQSVSMENIKMEQQKTRVSNAQSVSMQQVRVKVHLRLALHLCGTGDGAIQSVLFVQQVNHHRMAMLLIWPVIVSRVGPESTVQQIIMVTV